MRKTLWEASGLNQCTRNSGDKYRLDQNYIATGGLLAGCEDERIDLKTALTKYGPHSLWDVGWLMQMFAEMPESYKRRYKGRFFWSSTAIGQEAEDDWEKEPENPADFVDIGYARPGVEHIVGDCINIERAGVNIIPKNEFLNVSEIWHPMGGSENPVKQGPHLLVMENGIRIPSCRRGQINGSDNLYGFQGWDTDRILRDEEGKPWPFPMQMVVGIDELLGREHAVVAKRAKAREKHGCFVDHRWYWAQEDKAQ